MEQSKKVKVAVLYGGRSGEHEISLLSAANVIEYLDRSLFEVVPIGIDKQGAWFLGEDVFKQSLTGPLTLELSRQTDRMLFNPDLIGKQVAPFVETTALLKQSERMFDVVFPVIHGPLCEDGTIQGLLELTEVPYVGCGVLASAIGMDKDVSKRLVSQANIQVPPFLIIKHAQWQQDKTEFCTRVAETLAFPVFVKPANTGSSVGVEKVKSLNELVAAIDYAFHYDIKVIVEQGIDAIELEVAVLESLDASPPIVSVVGEVRPRHEFYTYAAKYLDQQGAELIIPADIPLELSQKVQAIARHIFLTLECEGMARIDLFLERGTQHIYFNEVNTLPGFTSVSMYPKLLAASGIPYKDLLTHLIMLALNRQKTKKNLVHEYLTQTL